jgi:hypothetical protein
VVDAEEWRMSERSLIAIIGGAICGIAWGLFLPSEDWVRIFWGVEVGFWSAAVLYLRMWMDDEIGVL